MNQKVDELARLVWKHVEKMSDEQATDDLFDEKGWQTLLIESEREEYRATARAILEDAS